MKKKSNKIIIIIFVMFILAVNILNILTPDKTFSETENRMLSQFPKISMKNITSGKFTKKFESYITDQFMLRDFWVSAKSDVERLILKNKNNGIFFGKDEFLLEDFNKPNETLDKNINTINNFSKKIPNFKTYLLLAPNSVKIYEDKLPKFSTPYDQFKVIQYIKENMNENIDFIDIYNVLNSKKNEYIYFKTDHHWTMRGAYYAYEALSNKIGIKPYDLKHFNSEIVSDSFYGTYYSKANNRHISPDYIEIFKPKFDMDYKVHWLDNDLESDSLYEYKHLDTKDKYSVFLDGNHSLMTIKTSVENNKKIVVFKDSYSHSFIPFLANHYEEIHVIDLRYYKLNLYEYINENEINEGLFLYNVKNFCDDNNIGWLR